MQSVDLTAGEFKILGNDGDVHPVILNNPGDETIINGDDNYVLEFESHLASTPINITLDKSEAASGTLKFDLLVSAGVYRVCVVSPRRTILKIEVEAL